MELNHFPCRSMSLEGSLHEAPVPESVDDVGRTGVDFKDFQSKTTGKGSNEGLMGRIHRLIGWVIAPELLGQGSLQ